MKRRNLFYKMTCAGFMVLSTVCSAMWDVKSVGPVLPGQSTWMTSAKFGAIYDETIPTPIFNSDQVAGVITIAAAGNYQLTEDINYPIEITASRVYLDLKTYKVMYTNTSSNVISITSGLSEVAVYNGYIQNTGGGAAGAGIYIWDTCSKISLRDLSIYGCHEGVYCAGTAGNLVTNSEFVNLNLISNGIGMLFEYADANIIRSCNVLYGTQSGVELIGSQANCFYDCTALKITGTETVAGFKSSNGDSNMFQRCVTKQTKTSSTTFGDKAVGFLLTGSETKTKILDSIVNETDVVSTPTAVTYGMHLAPSFNGSLTSVAGFSYTTSLYITAIKWSPNGQYVAVTWRNGGGNNGIEVFLWNGSTLQLVGQAAPTGDFMNDVTWSPDGKYLVAVYGDGNVTGTLFAYSFDGLTLTDLIPGGVATPGISLLAVSFSPNGKFLAATGLKGGGSNWWLAYSFNPGDATPANRIVLLGDNNLGGVLNATTSVSWSPDGQFIAFPYDGKVGVYKFYPDGLLQVVVTYAFAGSVSAKWSPCGKYIATGNSSGTVKILIFDGTTLTAPVQMTGLTASALAALTWSPDGKYIAVASQNIGGVNNNVWALQFTGTQLVLAGPAQAISDGAYSLSWSSDGKYVVVVQRNGGIYTAKIDMYNAMYGPTNCLIDNCRIADTKATNLNMGSGLVAGGPNNPCLRNASCNNGVNYSWGIPNVYDGRFEILRSVIQPYDNVSMPETL